jgi:hypothetical protein
MSVCHTLICFTCLCDRLHHPVYLYQCSLFGCCQLVKSTSHFCVQLLLFPCLSLLVLLVLTLACPDSELARLTTLPDPA